MKRVMRFDGKTALVTGAASGLGRGIDLAFAKAGSDLVLVDVNEEGLRETAAMIEERGGECFFERVDVSNLADMEELVDVLSRNGVRVDILVNNAGVAVGGDFKDIPMEELERIVRINMMGVIYGTKLFLPQMIERKDGYIVNVSSVAGFLPFPFSIAYNTTKYAVKGFTESLWMELRDFGIGVTLVCPGNINTNIANSSRVFVTTERWKKIVEGFGMHEHEKGMDPEKAGQYILRAVEKNRFLALIGIDAFLLYRLTRLSPALTRWILSSIPRYACRK